MSDFKKLVVLFLALFILGTLARAEVVCHCACAADLVSGDPMDLSSGRPRVYDHREMGAVDGQGNDEREATYNAENLCPIPTGQTNMQWKTHLNCSNPCSNSVLPNENRESGRRNSNPEG